MMKFISGIAGLALLAVLSLWGVAGLTDVDPGEVGILIKKIGHDRGMQDETLDTGLHWVNPITYDVATYNAKRRQYQIDDAPSKTKDGQPIVTDISLDIGLVDAKVPFLHETVGKNWFEAIIYPALRKELRDATTSILSDAIYTSEGRDLASQQITEALQKTGDPVGISILVNLRDISFINQDYIKILEEKAKKAQLIVVKEREAAAAVNEAIRVANIAEGQKQKRIKEAEAQREERRLKGEGQRLEKEENAKGILAIAQAEAEGVRLRREALSGQGGSELVSIEWAKNVGKNIQIYGVPTGAPGTTSIMDINKVIQGAFPVAGAVK